MNNEVKVSDMDKFDENIEKLTSILNNSRTTKRASSKGSYFSRFIKGKYPLPNSNF